MRQRRDDALAVVAAERRLANAALALATAARRSRTAVCEALFAAVHAVAPHVDGLLLFEEHEHALRCTFTRGERVAYYCGTSLALDDAAALPARALRAAHRVTLDDAGARSIHPTDAAAIAVPLDANDAAAVVVFVALRRLSDALVDRIVVLAEIAAPAFLVARDRERDRRTAEYDGLTGLLTPRAFRSRLATLLERARAHAASTHALIFVDTDHFKRFNDTYGHAAGDALLRRIADELRTASRERDLAARNGGDEFCLILADTGKAAAVERAELLRARIAAIDAAISASIGVAAFPADADCASALLERADAAMYHAKASGRDGVAFRSPSGDLVRYRGGA